MIVAITGGTGFVGKRLVAQHLANGDVVRVLSRGVHPLVDDRVEYFRHDLGTSDPVPLTFLSGADVIYHCAAELYDTHKMLATNVEGTKRLIDAARSRVRRWVQLSSVGVYGQTADVDEDSPEWPRTLYEFSKAKADELVRAAEASEAFEAVICRPTTVYGEEMENQSLYSLIRVINNGLFFYWTAWRCCPLCPRK
jgi:nucleoside-diphosphate-sugar epimerase